MARATHVKKAGKDHLDSDGNIIIAKGESYYWWKFRYGSKQYSKTSPRASQLTQSPFLSELYSIQEIIEDMVTREDIDNLDNLVDQIKALGEQCEDSRSNMPESLQDSETGELLQDRADNMETWAGELEAIDKEIDEANLAKDEIAARIEDILDEIKSTEYYGD